MNLSNKFFCLNVFFCWVNCLFAVQRFFYRLFGEIFCGNMNKIRYFIYLILCLVVASCTMAAATPEAQSAQISGVIQFKQGKQREIIKITISNLEPYKVFTVPNPDRLVVDVPSVTEKPMVSLPRHYKGDLIKAARFGHFNTKTSRFVFDMNKSVRVISKKIEDDSLVIEFEDSNLYSAKTSPQVETQKKKAIKETTQEATKEITQETETSIKADKKEVIEEKEKPSKKSKAFKEKTNYPPLIVIDAGHGGVDPGAIGEGGTYEKDVVLQYALDLKSKLVATKKYRVRLTRADDRFIPLRERVAIARRADANLFISLHADSAGESDAQGLSVYTVSENASDKEAEALAARENKSDIIAGMDLTDEKAEVADILISLAQRETKNNSATFADYLIMNLGDRVRVLNNAHRFAGFAVLKAPDIPSVLVEIGFLSNREQEKEIRTKAYRNKVIQGIVEGVEDYFRYKSGN